MMQRMTVDVLKASEIGYLINYLIVFLTCQTMTFDPAGPCHADVKFDQCVSNLRQLRFALAPVCRRRHHGRAAVAGRSRFHSTGQTVAPITAAHGSIANHRNIAAS
jgi:hypothetical protein